MTGGEPEVFERAKPVLDAMGENIVLMGPGGEWGGSKAHQQYDGRDYQRGRGRGGW